jgi:glycosyltransferase involved in cell wall biosynthesis
MLVSVIVRSYNRLPALVELVSALLDQDYPTFEVIVVEQSTDVPAEAGARLRRLEADPRLRVLRSPPLGGARARNVGARAARGDLLVLIDDDDLPDGRGWISAHVACYDDPHCLAVSGRHLAEDGRAGDAPSGRSARLIGRWTLALSPILKLPLTLTHHGMRRVPVELTHGTNSSLRRSTFARFGPWDERTRVEDEASLCLRAQREKLPEEYFAYDPRPRIRRRLHLPGGLAKRGMSAPAYFGVFLDFVHRILGKAFPLRVIVLYPLFVLGAYVMTLTWIWRESWGMRTLAARGAAALALLATLPVHVSRALARLLG